MMEDFYEILQVHPRADQPSVEASYLRLRDLYDPSRLEGAADELVELARGKRDAIERAYAVLSDPERRARYDAEQREQPPQAARKPVPTAVRPDDRLDYRPLPPARRAERQQSFEGEPYTAPEAPQGTGSVRVVAIFSVVLLAVLALGVAAFLLAGAPPGSLALTAPNTTPTSSPMDQFEPLIAQARQTAEQSPTNADAWIDYGNFLYDSVQIVREQQPNSPLYQERVSRWLQAADAYRRALDITPDNAAVRGDLGASSCFYGADAKDQQYVVDGLSEVRRAAQQQPDDSRILLGLGHCLIYSSPPQTTEALAAWQKIVDSQPATSPLTVQALQLIQQYGGS